MLTWSLGCVSSCYHALMNGMFRPWQMLLIALADWINRKQLDVIAYLRKENRVLREQLD